jgi:ribosomal protein S10
MILFTFTFLENWEMNASNNEIHQKLELKRDYKEEVHYRFIDFKKAYESIMKEVFYNIHIQSGIHMKW